MTADTDIVDKHDNPWVQIEQLQMEIERLQGENKHYRQLWHHLCDAIDIFKSEFGRGGLNP